MAWAGYRRLDKPTCDGRVLLRVGAAPEIAPAVQEAADRWTKQGAKIGKSCVAVDVGAAEPADVAAALAGKAGATINGVGQANGTVQVPDVWIPDSSSWLDRLRAVASNTIPGSAPSVAYSPVVVAMPEPVASGLGWPTTKMTWAALLSRVTTDTQLHTGIVEPTRDASGLSGLLALASAAAASGPNGQQITVGLLRELATGRSTLRQDLLTRFPRASDPSSVASALSAAPLSEQAVIAYNAAKPPVRLAAVYLDPAPVGLNYPYVTLPGLDGPVAQAAQGLQAALSGAPFSARLAAHGLRAPDGSEGAGFAAPEGAPPTPSTTAAAVDAGAVDRTLSTWITVTLPARMLAVIDVSGSMTTPVPTSANATREQVTVAAAQRGLSLIDDSWTIGLWIFSTLLDGPTDYRQLVPIGPVATQRTQLLGALSSIKPKADGNTGLYDTVLAAYKAVQNGWDPGRVNSVVLMTDGQNDDPGGMSLDQLVGELQKVVDPKRPIQLIAIGIGNDVSQAELDRITKVTGGGVFIATDPSNIDDIFLQAIALRTANPKN